jgi:hypothetical protein
VIFAGTSIKCGNTVYEVSTGTTGGNCTAGGSGTGPYTNTTCTDGRNEATASCNRGCGASQGAGNCTIKSVN